MLVALVGARLLSAYFLGSCAVFPADPQPAVSASTQDGSNPTLDRSALTGDISAIEFLIEVVDRRMYHLPGEGMKRACISLTIPSVEALPSFSNFELILLWQMEPAMFEINALGVPKEVQEDKEKQLQIAELNRFLSLALLRPVSSFLGEYEVRLSKANEGGQSGGSIQESPMVIDFIAKPGKELSNFTRWYTSEGKLYKETKVVESNEGNLYAEINYDMVEINHRFFLRSVEQTIDATTKETMTFEYLKQGDFQVLKSIHRTISTPEDEGEFTYEFKNKLNDQVTGADLSRARGQG